MLGVSPFDVSTCAAAPGVSQSRRPLAPLYGIAQIRVQRWNSVTSASTAPAGPTSNVIANPVTLRIAQDVTNRTYYYFAAGAWVQFYQESAGDFLTETDIGPGGVSNVGGGVSVFAELTDWDTSP